MKKQIVKKKNLKINRVYSNSLRHSGRQSSGAGTTAKKFLLFLFILLLPTQLGKHFFFAFSYLSGVRVDYLAPTLYLTDILAAGLILLNLKTVFNFFKQRKVLIVLLLLSLNLPVARSLPISVYRYIKFGEVIAVFAVLKKTAISGRALRFALLLGALFEMSLSLFQFVNKQSLQGVFYFFGERPLNLSLPGIAKASLRGMEFLRPYGTFSHPYSLAGFYLLIYFFILTRFSRISTGFNRFKLVSTVLLFISSLLIFLSFSKITIVAYLLLNFVFLWKSQLKKLCRFCLFARIFVLLFISTLFLQTTSDPLSLHKRVELAKNSLTIISQRPILGVGLGNYLIAQQQFPQKFSDFLYQPVHNIFLLLIAEIGPIAFVGLLLLL